MGTLESEDRFGLGLGFGNELCQGSHKYRSTNSCACCVCVCVFVAPVTLIGGHLTGALTQTEDTGHTAAAHTHSFSNLS